jgi:hypothetical protein
VGPRDSGQQRSTTVTSGQSEPQLDGRIGRDGAAGPYMGMQEVPLAPKWVTSWARRSLPPAP